MICKACSQCGGEIHVDLSGPEVDCPSCGAVFDVVVHDKRVFHGQIPEWYKKLYGTFPYNFNLADVAKGVACGLIGYGGLKLVKREPSLEEGAVAGALTGIAGGVEDVSDAIVYKGEPFAGDLAHEAFQSGLLNTLISTGTTVGILALEKVVLEE